MTANWRSAVDITCRVLAVFLVVFVAVVIIGDVATAVTRQIVMGVSAITWASVAGYQIAVALREDGWPRTFILSFRWVFAIYKTALALFVTWHLLVSFTDIYSREVSLIMWMILGQSVLFFFRRWVAIEHIQQAGVGETGTDGDGGDA